MYTNTFHAHTYTWIRACIKVVTLAYLAIIVEVLEHRIVALMEDVAGQRVQVREDVTGACRVRASLQAKHMLSFTSSMMKLSIKRTPKYLEHRKAWSYAMLNFHDAPCLHLSYTYIDTNVHNVIQAKDGRHKILLNLRVYVWANVPEGGCRTGRKA